MADSGERYAVVLTTAASVEQAEALAEALVERRLAACVNITGPVRSVYRWKGEIVREEERLLLIKTTAPLVAQVAEAIRALHSYEVPEVLALTVEAGDPDYLSWLAGAVDSERP